jgi:hypothetical protein
MSDERTVRTVVYMPASLKERLQSEAEDRMVAVSRMIAAAVEDYLGRLPPYRPDVAPAARVMPEVAAAAAVAPEPDPPAVPTAAPADEVDEPEPPPSSGPSSGPASGPETGPGGGEVVGRIRQGNDAALQRFLDADG